MIRAQKRRTGSFYTPAHLAAQVVRRVLGPLVRGRSRTEILKLRILDPACGDGVFLREAARFLGERAGAAAHRCLVGIDLDATALQQTAHAVRATLFHADALATEWRGANQNERFDAILGNPPWISYSGRHAQPLTDARRRFLSLRYETFSGWPSLHGPFLELAVRLCRPDGRIGLVLPAQVCDLDGYAPARAFVRAHCTVEEPILDCGEQTFRGVTQPCCALFLQKNHDGEPGGNGPFPLHETAALDRFARFARPPPGSFGDIGVHTGNCAQKLLQPGGIPIREGKDVSAFRLAPPRRTFRADLQPSAGEYFRASPLARYEQVPILLRQTADRPIAALHDEPTYFRNSVLACFGLPGIPDEVTVAWLNSTVVADYHRRRVREANQRAFPQLKLKHLRDLPLPHPNRVPAGLATLAKEIVREGRIELAADLDAAVTDWFGV